jgi:hypothetical protein
MEGAKAIDAQLPKLCCVGIKKLKSKIRRPRKYIGNTDISLLDSAA